MSAKIIIFLCSSTISFGSSASTYDQRQTGDLNIQVDLKDLRIIALMKSGKEEYVDYDYAYDYSEMTIKPQNGTTPKPLNSTSTVFDTVSTNNTAVPAVVMEPTTFNNDIKNNNTDSSETFETISQPMNESSTIVNSLNIAVNAAGTDASSTDKYFSSSSSRPAASNSTMCKKGFALSQKGDCELKLQDAGNALLKLVKLSQKLKLRRENRETQEKIL